MTLTEAREALRRHKAAQKAEKARREAERAAEPAYRIYWVNPIHALFHKLPSFTVPVDSFKTWAFIEHDFGYKQVAQCLKDVQANGRGFIETWFTCYIVEPA